MEGPENVTVEVANERGRLCFAKVMERIIKEMQQPKPDAPLLEALASCANAAVAEFDSD